MTQTILLLIALSSAIMVSIALYWNNKVTKFLVATAFVILANSVYFALDGAKGWPAEEPKEVVGTMASVVIVDPSRKDKGAIYIGVFLEGEKKWYEYVYPRVAPKTFYVEYSNNRAAQFQKAKAALENGQKVRINGLPPKNAESSEGQQGDTSGEGVVSYLGRIVKNVLPKAKDTYQPDLGLQIEELGVPPEKEKQQ